MAASMTSTRPPVRTATTGSRSLLDEISDYIKTGKGRESFDRFASELAKVANGGATQERMVALNYVMGMCGDSDQQKKCRADNLYAGAFRLLPDGSEPRKRFHAITGGLINFHSRGQQTQPQPVQNQRRS